MKSTFSPNLKAFTLVELLAVISIIGVLSALVTPALVGVANPNKLNRSISGVAGMLDQARQYAISQNTYTWVGFNTESSIDSTINNPLRVAVIASQDGMNNLGWSTATTSLPSNGINIIGKVETFDTIKLSPSATTLAANLPQGKQPSRVGNQANADVKFTTKVSGATATFDRLIQFTPSGEARVADTPVSAVDLGLQMVKGNTVSNENFAILQVSGMTGTTRVYRP